MAEVTLKDVLDELKKMNGTISRGYGKAGSSAYEFEERKSLYDKRREAKESQKKYEDWANKTRAKNMPESEKAASEADRRAKNAKFAKNSATAAITKDIGGKINGVMDSIFNIWGNVIKRQGIKLQAVAELTNRALKTYGDAYGASIKNQMANINGEVLDNAYNSLEAVLSGSKAVYMKTLQDSITRHKMENELRKNTIESAQQAVNAASGVASFFGPVGSIVGSAISIIGNATTKTAQLLAAQVDIEIKREEEAAKAKENFISEVDDITKSFRETSKEVNKAFLDLTNSAFQYGRSMFMSSENIQAYSEAITKNVNRKLAEFGMDMNDYYKMQSSYLEANGGRGGILGETAAMGMAGLSKVLGVDVNTVGGLTGAMNIFNTSIEDGNQLIYSMSKNAARMGLNATKYAKDLEKSLKLAEKYQFKNGVRGAMQMAMWAQKTRFNMDSLAGMLEKMHTGNIEDVLQTSAKLNVLGGNAGMLSDPMSMLFNAYADPEQYAKNVQSMIKGFGHFNGKTGETSFNINEQMRMEAMASALGMSKEDFFNMARQEKKVENIKNKYGDKFGNRTDFVTNQATWEEGKGWSVTMKNGERKTLDELSPDDINNIFPEDKQDQLISLVSDIKDYLSPKELQDAAKRNSIAATVNETYNGVDRDMRRLAALREADTTENLTNYSNAILATTDAAVKAQEILNKMNGNDGVLNVFKGRLEDGYKQYDRLLKEMETNDIWKTATSSVEGFAQALDLISDKMGASADALDKQNLIERTRNKKGYDIKDLNEQIQKRMEEQGLDKSHMKSMHDLMTYGLDIDTLDEAYGTSDDDETIAQAYAHGDVVWKDIGGGRKVLVYSDSGKNVTDDDKHPIIMEYDNRMGKYERNKNYELAEPPKKVNDAVITPRGTVYSHPNDFKFLFQKNGELGKLMQGGGAENISLTVGGTLRLEGSNGVDIDVEKVINNNPMFVQRITEAIAMQVSRNNNGGYTEWAPNRYAKV